MRVAMVAYAFYEGNARIQQYATALAARGDAVDIIALRRDGGPKFEIVDGVNVYGIQARTVNERAQLTYLYRVLRFFVIASVALARKHLLDRYDLVHVHSVPDFLVFAAAVPKLFGVPVILDIHDILPEFYASKFSQKQTSILFRVLKLVELCSVSFADHVIIANDLWRERLVARSAPAEKCTAIGNYPNPDVFKPWPRTRSDGKFVITYPGSLNRHQGLDVAIKAFKQVADQIPNSEFRIYGEGPSKEHLMALARQLRIDDRVVFKDTLPLGEIAKIMADTDLAIVPKRASSLFGNEAASTKILEFMAVGVPLIVSRTKIDSYYHSDRTVKFFESENAADLARSILLLYRDPELRKSIAAAAMKYAEENNWPAKKGAYLTIIDSLTRPGRGRMVQDLVP